MTKDEALRLALEALENKFLFIAGDGEAIDKRANAIRAIKAALDKPQRTWNELTLNEVKEAYTQHAKYQIEDMGASGWVYFADALQTILRNKNT
jgi:hypothetical protein